MKIAAVSSGSRRDAMRKRQQSRRIGAPALRTRYPDLDSMQLEFEFSDRAGFLPSPQVMVLHPPAPAYFCFACPYSDCDGEFDLTAQIDIAVSSGEAQTSGQARCTGTRHGGACTLCLDFSIAPHHRQKTKG